MSSLLLDHIRDNIDSINEGILDIFRLNPYKYMIDNTPPKSSLHKNKFHANIILGEIIMDAVLGNGVPRMSNDDIDKILIFVANEFKNIDFAIPKIIKSINRDNQLLEISKTMNLNFKKINTVEVHLLRLNKTGYELMIKLITPVVSIDYFINSDIDNRFEEPSAIIIEPNLSMYSQIGIELKKINSQRSKDLYLYNTSDMKKIKIKKYHRK